MPPISFLQAKERVCPDRPVEPGSKEHLDILELMRQSGHVFVEESIVIPVIMPPAKTIADLKLFRERPVAPKPKPVSKKAWLSIHSNRQAYEDHIAANRVVEPPGVMPDYLTWEDKVAPKNSKGMSKRQWVASLVSK
jgi:hypothetical protein